MSVAPQIQYLNSSSLLVMTVYEGLLAWFEEVQPMARSHFIAGFLFQARALLLGPTMSERGRSQAAWTRGPLGAGILYLSLIEPMGTPRALNRAQASSDVLMSLTMGQRERD